MWFGGLFLSDLFASRFVFCILFLFFNYIS